MSHENDLHVMPNQAEPLAYAETQEAASELATQMQLDRPEKKGGEVVIHGLDGTIRERSTINRKDPFPPRG